MMKKIILTSVCSLLSFGAVADTSTDMLANLAGTQKECVDAYGCIAPDRPEIEEAQQAYKDCLRDALVFCGVMKPEAKPADTELTQPTVSSEPKPEAPAAEPVAPAVEPSAPAAEPVPATEPVAPVVEPETPVAEASVPATEPAEPVAEPEPPVAEAPQE